MTPSTIVKILWTWGVVLSIGMSYYVMVEKQDFEVLVNPDGLPELEE